MTDSARPLRETVAKLVGDGITRHVNGVTSMRHNRTAIATVARQVSEDIEAMVLAETEQLDIDLTTARDEVRHLAGLSSRQDTELRKLRDHECVPTQWAYDRACAALEKHRKRADALAEVLAQVKDIVYRLDPTSPFASDGLTRAFSLASEALGTNLLALAAIPAAPTTTPAESCPDGANCCGGGACRE